MVKGYILKTSEIVPCRYRATPVFCKEVPWFFSRCSEGLQFWDERCFFPEKRDLTTQTRCELTHTQPKTGVKINVLSVVFTFILFLTGWCPHPYCTLRTGACLWSAPLTGNLNVHAGPKVICAQFRGQTSPRTFIFLTCEPGWSGHRFMLSINLGNFNVDIQ